MPLFHAQEPLDACVTSVWDSALSGDRANPPTTHLAIFFHTLTCVYLNYLEFARNEIEPQTTPTLSSHEIVQMYLHVRP